MSQPPPNNSRPITSQLGKKDPDYLTGLNEEQRDAVLNLNGPLLVLAGAGTGKTRVLTTRIAHILASNLARSYEILSVTFTNKASLEMKERIANLIGQSVEGMEWLGTFHSISARILRRHAELVGLKPDFTILDTDDQIRLIKQLLKAHNVDEKRWPARQFAAIIDGWKNKGLLPFDIKAKHSSSFANGLGDELYAQYQTRLTSLNAADFGDLLLLCIKLFRENPDVLAIYHKRFKYMLVDEYQDSNVAQYLWLRLLAQGKPANKANICVVGDDDQSIYGWRGAEVDNILRFEKDFPGAKTIKLERNYRSTGNILKAASNVIANNEGRFSKTLHADTSEMGEKIILTSLWDSEGEARHVAEQVEQLQHKGETLNSMAILVRTSAQMREFEEVFVKLGINYRVIGGAKFYERREIRDALAYLRLTHSQTFDLALERIINVPKRGIGNASVQILHEAARAQNIPLLLAIRQLLETEELGKGQRNTLAKLVSQFDDWAERSKTLAPFELAEAVLDESGYSAMWQNAKTADAPGRLENLKELVNFMQEFETLGEFLEHISLVLDRSSDNSQSAISIITLHGAKGLEFNNVFLPGWEEGLFPSQRALDESGNKGLEEERRLAYVGLTRAKKRLYLSLAQNRRIHGRFQTAIPSRFIDELPADAVEIFDIGSSFGSVSYGGNKTSNHVSNHASKFNEADPFDKAYETPGWKRMRANSPNLSQTIKGEYSESTSYSSSGYRIGQRVKHLKFGDGTITHIEGKKLSIDFDRVGRKKVLESFVRFE